ncbi:MAG: redoxin domain-containing protein [Ardenticatenia bacterium]|nr:redoxin domain-containing protein [Ardenticatenia bacterium]
MIPFPTTLRRPPWGNMLVLAMLFGGLWIWLTRVPADTPSPAMTAEMVPQRDFIAPDFELPTLDGASVRLSELRGKPVIVNFWATWCPPCRAEMPALQRIAQRYEQQGLTVILVNQGESPGRVRDFLNSLGITLPTLLDDGRAAQVYRVRGLPTTVFVRPDGRIEDLITGGPLTEPFLEEKVKAMLPGG